MLAKIVDYVKTHPGSTREEILAGCGCSSQDFWDALHTGWIDYRTEGYSSESDRLDYYRTHPPAVSCMDAMIRLEECPERCYVLDVETTGLDPRAEDVLQVSIIDGRGRTRMDELAHPYRTSRWPDAQRIHGIAPEDVRDAPSMAELRPNIERILQDATIIIGYNTGFDLDFLRTYNTALPACDQCDVMQEFAPVYGEWSDWFDSYKWQKLTTCAYYYGYRFRAHDSLEDVRATLHCCRAVAWDQLDDWTAVCAARRAMV